jgi:N-acetylmuramoyl-L-alanine amidase
MRKIEKIILHCSATPPKMIVGVSTIRDWHLRRGFSDVGYHYVITKSGSVELGRPLEEVGAHSKGQNKSSIGICYVGGLDMFHKPKDTMNDNQVKAFESLVESLRAQFGDLTLHGHNEYSKKACPCFVVSEKFQHLML